MFLRPRRRRRTRSKRHPALEVSDRKDAPKAEPWVALEIETLVAQAKRPEPSVEPTGPKPIAPEAPRYQTAYAAPLVVLAVIGSAFVLQDAVRRTFSELAIGRGGSAAVERAATADPGNAAAWFRLGTGRSRDGDVDGAITDLENAVARSGDESAPRIALALELERAGRSEEAERVLLDATARHAGFSPRWSLANFYLRQGNQDETWHWTHEAILADPSRLATAASLCWRAEADPALILAQAIPDTPEANRGYFAFLYDIGALSAMRDAWPRFSEGILASDSRLATLYVNELIQAGVISDALAAWNLLCDRLLLPHAPLAVGEEPQYLTNPYFVTDPSGMGFDWALHDHRGIGWGRPGGGTSNRSALEFRLTGAQDNRITLLSQTLPSPPGDYQLEFEFATQGMPIQTGVGWIVRDARNGDPLRPFESLNNAEGFWDSSLVNFAVPEGTDAVSLELHYRDVAGGVRRRSTALIRNLQLRPAERSTDGEL